MRGFPTRFRTLRPGRPALAGAVGLLALLLLGLGLRLALVPRWPQNDVLLYGRWCKFATLYGVQHVYDDVRYAAFAHAEGVTGYLATRTIYPPFLIEQLVLVGWLYRSFVPTIDVNELIFRYVVRAPAYLADLVLIAIVFGWVRRSAGPRIAWLAAAIAALNPAIAYTSGWTGQFDSVYALFLLLALLSAARRRPFLAGFCIALAGLTKLQAGAVLPIVVVAVGRLSGRAGLGRAALGALLAALAVGARFIAAGTVPQIVNAVDDSFGFYPYLTMGAFNFWLLVSWLASGNWSAHLPDGLALWWQITPRDLGLLLLAGVTILLAVSVWRRPAGERILVAAALQIFAFYLVATEMHERYIFPALPLLAVYLGRRLPTFLYGGLTIGYFINVYVLYWSWQPLGYALWFDGWSQIGVAIGYCGLFIGALGWFLRAAWPGRRSWPVVVPLEGLGRWAARGRAGG